MGEMSFDGNKRSGTRPARSRSSTRKPQQRGRGRDVIVVGGVLIMVAAAAVAMIAAVLPKSGQSNVSKPAGISDNEVRAARIIRDSADNGCAQQLFDNQTGRVMRSSQPCDTITFDDNGMPVRAGTMHRLDAFSKSFGGR